MGVCMYVVGRVDDGSAGFCCMLEFEVVVLGFCGCCNAIQ